MIGKSFGRQSRIPNMLSSMLRFKILLTRNKSLGN